MPYGVPLIVTDDKDVYSVIAYKHKTGDVSLSAVGWSGGDMSPDFDQKKLTRWMRMPLST